MKISIGRIMKTKVQTVWGFNMTAHRVPLTRQFAKRTRE